MEEVVCLGWGSLIWSQKVLPVVGPWQEDGPALPLEFARESRDKRITLVVCESAPAVTTLWARLSVSSLDEAKTVLAAREGSAIASIGWWSQAGTSRHPGAANIGRWAAARGFAGVVWTALRPKFDQRYQTPTPEEVVRHLGGLKGSARQAAEEYVRFAPRQIVTPYRTAIEGALGWTATGLV